MPGLTDPTGSSETALREWVTRQHDEGARVLGVCSGAMVLAATGMLDGLDATSHWSRIKALQASHPAVHWVRGQLYVDDGNVTTTAAVTSGVQGALHLVDELAGPKEAQRVADLHPELGWTPADSADDPRGPLRRSGLARRPQQPRAVVPAHRRDLLERRGRRARRHRGFRGVRTVSGGAPGRCRRRETACARGTDSSSSPPARRTHLTSPGSSFPAGGFTAALQDLADHTDAATALATAKMIGYPTRDLDLGTATDRGGRCCLPS